MNVEVNYFPQLSNHFRSLLNSLPSKVGEIMLREDEETQHSLRADVGDVALQLALHSKAKEGVKYPEYAKWEICI